MTEVIRLAWPKSPTLAGQRIKPCPAASSVQRTTWARSGNYAPSELSMFPSPPHVPFTPAGRPQLTFTLPNSEASQGDGPAIVRNPSTRTWPSTEAPVRTASFQPSKTERLGTRSELPLWCCHHRSVPPIPRVSLGRPSPSSRQFETRASPRPNLDERLGSGGKPPSPKIPVNPHFVESARTKCHPSRLARPCCHARGDSRKAPIKTTEQIAQSVDQDADAWSSDCPHIAE